jgi:hypothetical protein
MGCVLQFRTLPFSQSRLCALLCCGGGLAVTKQREHQSPIHLCLPLSFPVVRRSRFREPYMQRTQFLRVDRSGLFTSRNHKVHTSICDVQKGRRICHIAFVSNVQSWSLHEHAEASWGLITPHLREVVLQIYHLKQFALLLLFYQLSTQL